MSLLYFVDAFSAIERTTQLNNLIAFGKVSLVSILVHLSLRDSRRKLLVIISGVLFLFLSELVDTSIASVGVRFHFYHLPNFRGINGLTNLLGFFDFERYRLL